jgi:drug/metabolite transporter (DMT)-like permease
MVARLPAATAAIGVLLVPVVGVTASMAIIGDEPSLTDAMGFLLITTAVFITTRQDKGAAERAA